MIYYLIAWFSLGLISTLFILFSEWYIGNDFKTNQLPLCLLITTFAPASTIVAILCAYDVWGNTIINYTILKGRNQK